MNISNWVDNRLAALDVSGWRPNAARALAQLRARERARRQKRAGFLFATVAAALALLVISSPRACALPNGCADMPSPQAPTVNYKEQGSPSARVTLEIYTDYECPTCAMLYRDFMPTLMKEYVRTGKIKVLHRDYPLPQHLYSKLAARYANAAGRLGYYEPAVEQIFKTQDKWSTNGNIDAQLVGVLPPGILQKVREAVKNDNSLDATVDADLVMVRTDQVNQTPTMIVVTKGKRDPVIGIPRWDFFKTYLDGLLK